MKTAVYNKVGEEVAQVTLPKDIFEVALKSDLVHQVAVCQASNRRQSIAHTKGRGEVSGGGKKPWRQKGTGRARHGSNRSPIWRHGGVTFGPTNERNFEKGISKKMQRKAMFMVLSQKIKNNALIVLDELSFDKPKTKEVREILNNLKLKISTFTGKGTIIALSKTDKNAVLSVRNLVRTAPMQAKDLNCLDLLSYKYLVLTKNSLKDIKETFSVKSKVSSEEE
ncbi:MAG: 50S ribosomal protein L4 [Candidatus Paceibacterota bacterium]|jgi:large subunit ribosomal protein L4